MDNTGIDNVRKISECMDRQNRDLKLVVDYGGHFELISLYAQIS